MLWISYILLCGINQMLSVEKNKQTQGLSGTFYSVAWVYHWFNYHLLSETCYQETKLCADILVWCQDGFTSLTTCSVTSQALPVLSLGCLESLSDVSDVCQSTTLGQAKTSRHQFDGWPQALMIPRGWSLMTLLIPNIFLGRNPCVLFFLVKS